ncbi:hypothetical protein Pla110_44190 [Polystyrenella longa]|uniref:Uncharacterized protein n=2 Tax=Polystyrenella longa TaxID=2528007 RepID=A0A518CTY2_9PLAN|nr:hypothetical protein Pla110_44190 [Polystyrenella longa]
MNEEKSPFLMKGLFCFLGMLAIVMALMIGAFWVGYFSGREEARREAEDAGAGGYNDDGNGGVTWEWHGAF